MKLMAIWFSAKLYFNYITMIILNNKCRGGTNLKATSVGILITNGSLYLACHSTGNSFYDLPKGLQEEGEMPIEVCLRETKEETGILLNANELTDLGVFPYLRNKDLHLFMWVTQELPGTDSLFCASFFEHPKSKKRIPEVDGYRYVSFEESEAVMTKNMARIIQQIVSSEGFFT
jgi:8-oxo-dGTP pyrophosphatase MutT (NUDIX family)